MTLKQGNEERVGHRIITPHNVGVVLPENVLGIAFRHWQPVRLKVRRYMYRWEE
jgi:hypothetical protein